VLEEDVPAEVLVEVEEAVLGSESLLAEDVEVEAHFEDGEPLGDGAPQPAQERAVHEVKVVDCVAGGVRRRCS
jgi:hypothetical protein